MEKEIGNNKKMERVCEICEKVFSSGKALGGHMRSHLHTTTSFNKQHRRQENAAAEAAGVCAAAACGKCRCVICGKNFPSMKSLFGHMRCHPDRDWRGINPPPPPPPLQPSSTGDNLTSSSSSASSSLSDANNPPMIGFEDRMRGREKAVDLTESLRGWAVTAKRGRKGAAAEEDDRLRDAVNFLMMLAEGKHMHKHKHNSCEGEEVVDIDEERERGVVVGGESDHEMKKLLLKKKMMMKTKKRKKKVKQLCDLKLTENDSYNILDHNTKFPTTKGVKFDFDLNEEPPLEPSS